MKDIIIDKLTITQKNINKTKISKSNASTSQWWGPYNIFKPLHHINLTRFNYIIEHSNGLFGKKVLDVGCGGGILSESMAQAGAKVIGLDISTSALEAAKLHALNQNLNIHYIQETIKYHALNHIDYYDVITCMEVLEHVPDPISIVHACSTMIKIDGSVFFSTLNRTFKSWLLVIIGAEYFLRLIQKGTHNFNKFITPSELLEWIDSTTLEEQNITGLYYNPFTKKCALIHNIDTNYILHTQRK
ncbi:bifunctional 2-polyprenyl-6-hydroxyphenol methylase/3-demethylubiquinol 3-O-methyltransferase UbiG [Blochmannia endosymbiont of Camponotus sp.]|uniref:bifunctional 2-polyprenyl-6-hydroxyphenol methylase/3-demethylubiquinol 3-O-methyltransferase UbiG n=1 Tax=Blochmannia endosymbiont of Camponotus sp. TaxID=700220 RepID=UPI0020252183|nr:bifunctional 2-polyprenyl-6-hydroxyphenol methylase/3-demethylubiquinol 3-O-methyltransferase UbiG [Blochmannia endosymbiont of Camponotus sp.]URJ29922.1 bifunctional 2-polyprenyl-6-hydroxyphenol methylase/3-demethylubiquinol 3-O-methyltransferase UbiG [Blochmannia endosymbiont of Camponotus sp.]